MSLMGNHGYDESTDPSEIVGAQSDAEYFAQTVDERMYLAEVERRNAAEVAELLGLDA